MRKTLTITCLWLSVGLCSCVHRAQAQRPPQSVRLSKIWSGPAAHGGNKTGQQAVLGKKRLRPAAGIASAASRNPAPRTTLKSRLAERRAQNELLRSRSRQMAPPAQGVGIQWPWGFMWPQIATPDPGRMQFPGPEGMPMPPRFGSPEPVDPANDPWFANSGNGSAGLSREPEKQSSPPALAEGKAQANARGAGKPGGEYDHLPFGVKVPGKTGYVTLSQEFGDLPEIDVRGIAPGTPVEIPNPNKPGSSIQFRVP